MWEDLGEICNMGEGEMLQKRAAPKDGPFPLDQLRDFRDAASVRSAPRLDTLGTALTALQSDIRELQNAYALHQAGKD